MRAVVAPAYGSLVLREVDKPEPAGQDPEGRDETLYEDAPEAARPKDEKEQS